jgi:hypothetical protein
MLRDAESFLQLLYKKKKPRYLRGEGSCRRHRFK